MKIKPIITIKIETRHTSFDVNLDLTQNITFIAGDSGVGKSAVFTFLQEASVEDNRIKCFNYIDYKTGYKQALKNSNGKLFVIDNADILLDDSMREYIAADMKNQYIIFGRNPSGLLLQQDEIFELKSEKLGDRTRFSLIKAFD